MSTKAIRQALEWMRSDGYSVLEAMAELDAIEKAAKVIDSGLAAQVFVAGDKAEVEAAFDVLASIASEAK